MACYHPIPASRNEAGRVQLGRPLVDTNLQLPCGTCLGCQSVRAQHWALRCQLEAQDHRDTAVTTLTYDNEHVPPTLSKHHYQLWMKRLRKAAPQRVRHFGCGEYGEQYGRPHYHVILFGLHYRSPLIQDAWPHGLTHNDNVSVEAIQYVTNYTLKKGWRHAAKEERLDPDTGELYTFQPPFQLMSRRPGIGANAKQHYHSWALYGISNGNKISIPRFYKSAFTDNATPNEMEEQEYQKYKHTLTRHITTEQQLINKEKIHYAKQQFRNALRKYE